MRLSDVMAEHDTQSLKRSIVDRIEDQQTPLLASARELALDSRMYVDLDAVRTVFALEEKKHGEAAAFGEVIRFISVWENYDSPAQTEYNYYLPVGHPRHNETFATRRDLADYMSTQVDKSLVEAVVASICSTPDSIERSYHAAMLKLEHPSALRAVEVADKIIAQQEETSRLMGQDIPLYVED